MCLANQDPERRDIHATKVPGSINGAVISLARATHALAVVALLTNRLLARGIEVVGVGNDCSSGEDSGGFTRHHKIATKLDPVRIVDPLEPSFFEPPK